MCAFVHGFQPYFYIEAPRGFGPDDCDSLCSQLNVRTPSGENCWTLFHKWQAMRHHFRACKCLKPACLPKGQRMLQVGYDATSPCTYGHDGAKSSEGFLLSVR